MEAHLRLVSEGTHTHTHKLCARASGLCPRKTTLHSCVSPRAHCHPPLPTRAQRSAAEDFDEEEQEALAAENEQEEELYDQVGLSGR